MTKKITFWTLLLTCFLSYQAFSQGLGLKAQGDKAYARLKYATAIDLYEQYLQQDSTDLSVKKNLADSYRKVGDSKNAERLYGEVVTKDPNDAKSAFAYAQMLSENGKYEEAKVWYSKYQQLNSGDPRGTAFTQAYNNLGELYADSLEYKIFKVDINSDQSDFSPTYYDKGLVFVSGRRPDKSSKKVYAWNNTAFLDLFYVDSTGIRALPYDTDTKVDRYTSADSYKTKQESLHSDQTRKTSNDNSTLGYYGDNFPKDNGGVNQDTRVTPFDKKINSKFHEGPAAFTKDGNTIYFTRNNYLGSSQKGDDGIVKLKIYTSEKKNGEWSRPKELPFNNKNYSVGHPALSPDGNTLYFVSDMPGGFGGTDIYKVAKGTDGKWSTPENLGKAVNTEGNEMFPYVDNTNKLYFSSNGHAGLGGLDIFETDLNSLGTVENIGFPINSKKDDFGIIVDSTGRQGYFSSNRGKGGSDDDIYMFRKLAAPIQLFVYAYENENTQDTLRDVPITVKEEGKEGVVPGKNTNGLYTFNLNPDKNYTITGKKDTATVTKNVSTTDRKPGEKINEALQFITDPDLIAKLKDPNGGKKKLPADCDENRKLYSLDNVYYDFDKASVRADAKPVLTSVVKLMKKYPDIEIIVSSYTDARGTNDPYNIKLSAKRSDAVYNYLLKNGVTKNRLSKESNSENAPVNDCKDGIACTEVQHQLNRRTEFYVVKNGRNITKECELITYKLPNRIDPADVRLIYFDLNKSEIRSDAGPVLDELVETLKQNPGIKIAVASFADSRASQNYNYALSRRRLQESVNYLINKGVSASRIRMKEFYGETHLANDCRDDVNCNEEQHQANRRTEIRIIR
ncbi:OmpA family protein [Xanthocytophaga flava]|uniref:OmpA family protein n=1 Tax=Xanthocytophaga flava TaxID=3048013 RepID=UPI0028D2FD75|nr:OmpA family protein [Xanthocytophaga flavus]MDJ1468113.1 OmpA family protein [Xanthocytophaga flavus]